MFTSASVKVNDDRQMIVSPVKDTVPEQQGQRPAVLSTTYMPCSKVLKYLDTCNTFLLGFENPRYGQ